jgi:hypothetical protein
VGCIAPTSAYNAFRRPNHPKSHIPQAWPPSISPAARSVVLDEGPTADYCGQARQDRNIHQLPAAASPVPSMPKIVVNGSDFVRYVVIRFPNLGSAGTCIEACHGDLPHKTPNQPEPIQEIAQLGQRREVAQR